MGAAERAQLVHLRETTRWPGLEPPEGAERFVKYLSAVKDPFTRLQGALNWMRDNLKIGQRGNLTAAGIVLLAALKPRKQLS